MSTHITAVVAEDCVWVRDSVVRALTATPNVAVVGSADTYDAAVQLVDRHRPSILITDVRMPPTSTDEGIRLAQWVREAQPATGVIVLSQYVEHRYASGLLTHGSAGCGYLLKERVARIDELADAVRQVAAGGTVLDPLVVESLLTQTTSTGALSALTTREREVLGEVATGFSNRTIAQRLVLSPRAVEKHINSIFSKLGLTIDTSVDRRVKAVLMFFDAYGPS